MSDIVANFDIVPSIPAPDDAVAPTEPPELAVRNVFELAADYEYSSIDSGQP